MKAALDYNPLLNTQTRITMSEEVLVAEKFFEEEVVFEETSAFDDEF